MEIRRTVSRALTLPEIIETYGEGKAAVVARALGIHPRTMQATRDQLAYQVPSILFIDKVKQAYGVSLLWTCPCGESHLARDIYGKRGATVRRQARISRDNLRGR